MGIRLPGIPQILAFEAARSGLTVDRELQITLWQLIAGTRGGPNRARILQLLADQPSNTHQLAKMLNLDYKTTQHHLRALSLNGLVRPFAENAYGTLYFLTPRMEHGLDILKSILARTSLKISR